MQTRASVQTEIIIILMRGRACSINQSCNTHHQSTILSHSLLLMTIISLPRNGEREKCISGCRDSNPEVRQRHQSEREALPFFTITLGLDLMFINQKLIRLEVIQTSQQTKQVTSCFLFELTIFFVKKYLLIIIILLIKSLTRVKIYYIISYRIISYQQQLITKMLQNLLGPIQPSNDAYLARLRAPICEQYAREIEEQTFYDYRTNRTFTHESFSSSIKKFGYGGTTHLNQRHILASFSQVDDPAQKEDMCKARAVYLRQEQEQEQEEVIVGKDQLMKSEADDLECVTNGQFSVDHLLHLSTLLCSHDTQLDQLNEMWLLVNPKLADEIEATTLLNFVGKLAEIAVLKTKKRLEGLNPGEPVKRAQCQQTLRYLEQAEGLLGDFLSEFKASLPSKLSFEDFSQIVCTTCINSSQLRMLITKTKQTSTSRDVVISQVSTIILSYLTPAEQVQKAQLTCHKWYDTFLPQVMGKFKLNFRPWQSQCFRLAYEEQSDASLAGHKANCPPLYLALVTDRATDVRESCGRTHYVSCGSSQEHKDFAWTIDSRGALVAGQAGPDGQRPRLAAHRTYINDCVGKTGTFVISTNYEGHENSWKLERIGDFESHRYMISLGDSKCVKDNVNQVGWAITAAKPSVPCAKSVVRDEISRYVYVCSGHLPSNQATKATEQDAVSGTAVTGSLNHFPIWRLEPMV